MKTKNIKETMAGCGHFCDMQDAPLCGDCAKELFLSMPGHERMLAVMLRQCAEYHSQPVIRGEDLFHLNLGSCIGESAAYFFRNVAKKFRGEGVRA